ncbi:PEP-CTERM sorting domain-containing protein [Puniceicoccus vermicola]|uniref:PEP-CTERM sorting domain-containing protein n=1 Tax=Puniceicoccus vermicola TaxID=388746 RepID=A0A7X1AYF1_9BACT|nr:PEP-CTERM sorting domain-containing protein [Puniceicoccus vermicola]MBC2602262.1 PEP-CTERM sorting domain-containing protein [Puniceicoccus vermicola]
MTYLSRSLGAGCLALSLQLLPASAADQYKLDIVNNNTGLSDLWVTFLGAEFSSAPSWSGGQSISTGTSYKVSNSMIGTAINNMPTDWSGNMYLSNSSIGSTAPNPTNFNTDQYQILEFSGSATSAAPDITYINYYSFPVELHSTDAANTSSTRGTPKAGVNLSQLRNDLAGLTSSTNSTSSNTTVVRNSTSYTAAGPITRVISPANGSGANGSVVDKYPSFAAYLSDTFPSASPVTSIKIDNTYSGEASPPNVRFEAQTYTVSSISYDATTGDLKIEGSSTDVNTSTTKIDSFTLTSNVDVEAFSESIYQAVLDYDYSFKKTSGETATTGSGNTGSNDVFATVTRDLLAGFSFGFIGSDLYGDDTSEEWQKMTSEYYGDLWSSDKEFYNQWANVFQNYFDDVYTQQFSDFLANSDFTPTIQVGGGETLTVTLLDESSFIPEPASAGLLLGGVGILLTLRRRQRR